MSGERPTAKPVVPSYPTDGGTLYPLNIDAAISAMARPGFAFAPSAQDTPNMTVRLEAGALLSGATRTEVAAQSTSSITPPSVHPRIDLVYIDKTTGAVGVATGTEASSPTEPALPNGKLPVALVHLTVGMTAITNGTNTLVVIEDIRVPGGAGANIVTTLASPNNQDVPSTQAVASAIAAIPTGDTLARDNAAMNAFVAHIQAGRATGPIPSGYIYLFLTDELPVKTNAVYDATGDYYYSDAGYGSDITTSAQAISDADYNTTYSKDKAFDKNNSTYWGALAPTTAGVDYIGQDFGAGITKSIRRMTLLQLAGNYVTSVKAQFSDDGTNWTDAGTFAVTVPTANTLDIGAYGAHRYWILRANSGGTGAGGANISTNNWGVYEVTMHEIIPAASMTLVSTAITAGGAPGSVDLYLLHKAVDATTLNVDLNARVSRDNGDNWSAFVTLAEVCQYDSNYKLLKGTADLSDLASGTSVKWEVTTRNSKSQRVRAAAMTLNS